MFNSISFFFLDIDECEESSEICRRDEVCVNLPGAYACKSKISTLPKWVFIINSFRMLDGRLRSWGEGEYYFHTGIGQTS